MNEVYEIGNGQSQNTEIHDICGTLDCMHDQKAILIRQNGGGNLNKAFESCGYHRNPVETEVVGTVETENNSHIRSDTPLVMDCKQTIVRRLTPKEAERLQGFPDDWTDIGEWTDSKGRTRQSADGLRYKAIGNSLAIPFWEWSARRIVAELRKSGTDRPTMASLFDGIGGFPLAYSRAGCKPVWASEIEEFPIAVTKRHFPEQGNKMKGNENELSESDYGNAEHDGG